MLGDNAEKSKNPLKKAMRRRNAKTVTFASPTYFEASEVEYSTEEEDEDDQFIEVEEEDEDDADEEEEEEEEEKEEETRATQKAARKNAHEQKEDDMTVEPLRPKQQQQQQQPQKEPPTSDEERQDAARKSEDSQMSDDFNRTGKSPSQLMISPSCPSNLFFFRNSQGGPEMVWLETRIRSSRMIVLRPRKYLLPPTFFATIQQAMYSR